MTYDLYSVGGGFDGLRGLFRSPEVSLPVTPRFSALPGFGLFCTSGSEVICPVENHTHLLVLLASRGKKFTCRSGEGRCRQSRSIKKRIEKKRRKCGRKTWSERALNLEPAGSAQKLEYQQESVSGGKTSANMAGTVS